MQKEILINVESGEKRVAVVQGNELQDYFIERSSEETLVGNIYKGVIKSIVSGIGAAFVDIGYSKNGFLYVSDILAPAHEFDLLEDMSKAEEKTVLRGKNSDIHKLVKVGEEVLVQVVKESIGNKGPRLTTHIGIPGRYVVLMSFDRKFGVSKKIIDREERSRLHKILKSISSGFNMGLIVRTAGVGKSEKDLKRESRYLDLLWQKIRKTAAKTKAPSLIHEEYGLTYRILRDIYSEDVARVLVDSREEYKKLRHFANNIMPSMKSKLMLYREKVSLFESRGIEKEIEKLYRKKIELKCGGYIFIEETEGLIAIDVNSGSFSRKEMEETAFKVNCEAAVEIARQIRLRDIGGIVVIDFIDVYQERHKREIFNILLSSVKRDKARIKILKMSEFGVVEMTRQRIRKGVRTISYQNCPYCSGRGSIKSITTVSIEVLRAIRKAIEQSRVKEIRSYVHPSVANHILNENRGTIAKLEAEHKARVIIIAEPEMHVEKFKVA